MVQSQKAAAKQDHSTIRQLLSTGARVPPIAVFKANWAHTKPQESPCQTAIQNPTGEKDNTLESNLITTALSKVDNENISELIGLPPSCELFPEINLSLPDFDDIDTVVLTDETFEDSFSIDNLSSHLDNKNVPPPVNEEICHTSSSPIERDSPMQVSSGSDSELCSSTSSVQFPVLDSPGTSTIQSLLARPPAFQTPVPEPQTEPQMEDGLGIPGIPLTALALADDEAAPASKMILQKLDEQDQAQSMSEMSSNEEDEEEEEMEKPVRRRKWATSKSSKIMKKERHMSSTSSDQEFGDFDDNDSEVRR